MPGRYGTSADDTPRRAGSRKQEAGETFEAQRYADGDNGNGLVDLENGDGSDSAPPSKNRRL